MSEIPPTQTGYNPPPSSSFDLNAWFNIWRKALTQPSVATFKELEHHPLVTLQNALIWNAISGAFGGLLGGLVGLATKTSGAGNIIYIMVIGAIGGVVGWLIYALIVYAISKAQGGTGTFQAQAALTGTFVPPVYVILLLLGQIPILGIMAAFVLAIYQMYLYVVATQAAQNISLGKAALAVLLPGMLALICAIVVIAGLIAFLMPIFSTRGPLP